MGNHRFRLSDMIPNAWFYKLTDMSNTRKHTTATSPKKKPPTSSFSPQSKTTLLSQTRYSYYITTDHQKSSRDERSNLQEQPRSSLTKRSRRKAVYKPSPKKHGISSTVSSSHCSCHASTPDSPDYFGSSSSDGNSTEALDFHELIPYVSENATLDAAKIDSFSCRVSSSTCQTTLDKKREVSTKKVHERFELDDHKNTTSSKLKEAKGQQQPLSVKLVAQEISSSTSRTHNHQNQAASFGIRLRGKNPPRLAASKKLQQHRKSVTKNRGAAAISDSFAVVKSSLDPHRDFKDSMMEMIMEKNLKESKDLEDLLACYLSLNKREYHDLIVKAFEQIWFDMAAIKI